MARGLKGAPVKKPSAGAKAMARPRGKERPPYPLAAIIPPTGPLKAASAGLCKRLAARWTASDR
jgi:hypothetical protein